MPASRTRLSRSPLRFATALSALFTLALALPAAQAQTYPDKPITVIVPFTTGGAADTLARVISQHLGTKLNGQSLVVLNRPGAGGTIGMAAAKSLPNDGYNVVLISNSLAASQAIYPNLSYDVRTDFAGIVEIADAPVMIAANPSTGIKTMKDLVDYARKNPGKLVYGSCGVGTAHHLAMEIIKARTKTDIVHASYRGCTPAVLDAVGGQIPLVVASSPAVMPQVKNGKLVAIAITNPQRAKSMPDLPTISESGVPELKDTKIGNWYGFSALKGMPADRVKKLADAVSAEMRKPEVVEQLSAAGVETQLGSGKDLDDLTKQDVDQFGVVIRALGIKPE